MEAMLPTAAQIAAHFSKLDEDQLDLLEVAREACRNLCLQVGLGPHTASLGILWCSITAAQVQMNGLAGDDIDVQSMGVPSLVKSFDVLKEQNKDFRFYFHKELKALNSLLPTFRNFAPELIQEVESVVTEVFGVLAMD